jgi:hypothetical protein
MRPAEAADASRGVLLLPVSGASGSGELQRCLLLARALHQRLPDEPVTIAAADTALAGLVATGMAFRALPGSPTRCTPKVVGLIRELRPKLVLFDSTARSAQLAAARECGAQVIYLSSRPSARRRGWRLANALRIDEHWSVELDPDGRLPGFWPRRLAAWFGRPRWRPLSVLFETPDAASVPEAVRDWCAEGDYLLLCPGGGTQAFGAVTAAQGFAMLGAELSRTGIRSLTVRADWPPGRVVVDGAALVCGTLPNAALMALVARARLCVLGAGSLLLQGLALGRPVLAIALAEDQRSRLAALARRGAVIEAQADRLAEHARALWVDEAGRAALQNAAQGTGLRNGIDEALATLAARLQGR